MMEAIYVLTEIIEENIKKTGGKVYACFADLKVAFDKIDRKRIRARMKKTKISKEVRRKIEEIYEETFVRIMIEEEIIDEFETEEGVRQGCLNAILFNISVSDLEEMRKVQGGGTKIGKERIRTISYADDFVILAENEECLKEMVRFLKYMERRGLEMNVEK